MESGSNGAAVSWSGAMLAQKKRERLKSIIATILSVIVLWIIARLTLTCPPSSSSLLPLSSTQLSQRCPPPPSHIPPPILHPLPPHPRVLVTGGAGYLGSHFILLLLTHETSTFSVTVVDDLSRGDIRHMRTLEQIAKEHGKEFLFIQADVGDTKRMEQVMKEQRIDAVVHFAGFAYASESMAHPLLYFDNIVTRTQSLLETMEAAGVNKLIYSSSSATYGSIDNVECDLPLHEWSPQHPVSPYGQSKLMAEQVITAFTHAQHGKVKEFSAVMLRYFNVIGADPMLRVGAMPKPQLQRRYGRIVDGCLEAALRHEHVTLYGRDYDTPDGTAIRDYIHVMDLVQAHVDVFKLLHGKQVMAYNVGIGRGFSNLDVISSCRSATSVSLPIRWSARRHGDPARVIGDASKLMREVGWRPKWTDLKASIESAWRWRLKLEQERLRHVASAIIGAAGYANEEAIAVLASPDHMQLTTTQLDRLEKEQNAEAHQQESMTSVDLNHDTHAEEEPHAYDAVDAILLRMGGKRRAPSATIADSRSSSMPT